ncbi:MAG: metal-dependent hydrolase [Myxococcales bacterium]|nr:metal-dependent hydrolase [Myxococcales bacterium]
MANFRTHLAGAALPSLAAAYAAVSAGLVDRSGGLVCLTCGVIGGVLPDVDAETSVPTRIIFTLLGVAAGVAAIAALWGTRPPALAAGVALGVALCVRYGLHWLTHRLCVHRGIIHSLPVAALCGAAVATLAAGPLSYDPLRAWLFGAFVSAGFVIHLLLDELFSVDLLGARLRRSFGTALKLGALRNLVGTAVVYAALIALVLRGPPIEPLWDTLTAPRTVRAALAAFGV